MRRIVVVGASLAGHQAAMTLRKLGYEGALTIVGSEPHRPYDRCALSYEYLRGETDRAGLDLGPDVPDADWRLASTATWLDLERRTVVLDHTERLGYDGLVIASGARPRDRAMVDDVEGAFVLRTVEDASALRSALFAGQRRVVVVGGGLIGVEVADTAAAAGHDTTLVHGGDLPAERALGRPVAAYASRLLRARPVHLRAHARARRLDVRRGRVEGVVLDDGSHLRADVVLMATGTRPNVEWLRGSGLSVAGGVNCGPTLHALGADRVVAAGDVARTTQPLLDGARVRVQHWASTLDQAALAAANLLSGRDCARDHTSLPWFGSLIGGSEIRCVGFPHAADGAEVVWGSLEDGRAALVLSGANRPVAAVTVNATERLPQLESQLQVR
ncbi:NAD(P)/FAD-dependent oxidoreductase (plasmid) [Nocardioides sp. R1-1]|uniref:NAD(P)/FAD-dependent oxidoreductase n=1 Tax=Nocardioides sp. R1-1 TaxID=3383502 RepID=UPI0038D1EFE0